MVSLKTKKITLGVVLVAGSIVTISGVALLIVFLLYGKPTASSSTSVSLNMLSTKRKSPRLCYIKNDTKYLTYCPGCYCKGGATFDSEVPVTRWILTERDDEYFTIAPENDFGALLHLCTYDCKVNKNQINSVPLCVSNTVDEHDPEALWQITDTDGGHNVKNLMSGLYLNKCTNCVGESGVIESADAGLISTNNKAATLVFI